MSGPEPPCGHLLVPPGDPNFQRLGLGAAALRYAALGLPVFPLKPGTKEPATRHGFLDASTDPAVITREWAGGRGRNIGIATGQASGLAVIDLDRHSYPVNGVASFLAWLAEHGLEVPPGPWAETPSGGRHLFLRLPAGRTLATAAGILPGVDIRADGGYVAAWPSGIAQKGDSHDPATRRGDVSYGTYDWHGCPHQAPEAPGPLLDALGQLHGTGGGGGGGSGGGNGAGGWTSPDPAKLTAEGIPPGVTQRPVLRDLVWLLVAEGKTDEQIRAAWQQVVSRTALTRPSEPWEERHFRRELEGARAKQPGAIELAQAGTEWVEATMPGPGPATAPDPGVLSGEVTRPAELTGTVVGPPQVVFPRTGLDAVTSARWVMGRGPLRYGADHQLWAYQHGVWVPGEDPAADLVHQRITYLLGRHFRQAHESNAREVIRAHVPYLDCGPVPGVINFRDGLLHWRQGDQLHPHDPSVLSTVQLAVSWNPAAACPLFDRFLAGVLAPGDVNRMWEVIGYLLMSGNPLHKMILLYGRGFNGKGVLLRVLTALLGSQNVSSVSLHALADNRFAPIRLLGKIANICGDIDATYIERTGLLKQLTGEDEIDGEHKFRRSAKFTSWAVPWFSANEIPASSDTSYGWRERWEPFHFPNTFAHDPALEPALRQPGELEGIAASGVRALRVLMARTPPAFARTAAGEAAKAEFTSYQDPLHGWVSEEALAVPAAWTDQRNAFASYKLWCETAGIRLPLAKLKFYKLMREHYGVTSHHGWPGFAGLQLKSGAGGFSG